MLDFKFSSVQFQTHMNVMKEIRDTLKGIQSELAGTRAEITDGATKVAGAISELQAPEPPPAKIRFEGGGFVRTYKGDRPAETVVFNKPQVVDSEGTPLSPQPTLTYEFTSDKPEIVGVSATDDGGPTVNVDVTYGTPAQLEDGSFDIAEVRATSNDVDDTEGGTLVDVKTEQIQLVPGDAAGFANGGFGFPDA